MTKKVDKVKEEIKNPILKEMKELLENEVHKIDDEVFGEDAIILTRTDFKKFTQEVRAKTNYVNTLIDQLQEGNKSRNQMAENNHNLLQTLEILEEKGKMFYAMVNNAGAEMNEMRERLEDLCKGADYVESGAMLKIMNEYEPFDVDEDTLIDETDVNVITEYES